MLLKTETGVGPRRLQNQRMCLSVESLEANCARFDVAGLDGNQLQSEHVFQIYSEDYMSDLLLLGTKNGSITIDSTI